MLEHAISARQDVLLPLPKHYCKDCKQCISSGGEMVEGLLTAIRCRCTFYNRPVEPLYNKCFNHSNYSPVHTHYEEPENIVEIAIQNELKRIA